MLWKYVANLQENTHVEVRFQKSCKATSSTDCLNTSGACDGFWEYSKIGKLSGNVVSIFNHGTIMVPIVVPWFYEDDYN